jgi:hypothetical protein
MARFWVSGSGERERLTNILVFELRVFAFQFRSG